MAVGKSWTISVPITREGGTWGYIKVTFQEEYDSTNNYSTLSVIRMTGSNTIRSGGFQSAGTIYVNGGAWYSWNANNWVFSGLAGDDEFSTYSGASYPRGLVIYHDEDGRKTIEVAVNVSYYYGYDTNWSGNGGTISQSVTLTEIPRASALSVTNGRLGVAQTLLVDRKASGYTHTITYQCGGASGTVCTKSSSTNVTWTPPIELARENTRGKTVDVAFTVATYSGSTVIGTKTASSTLTIPPSVCLRYEDGWATASPYNEGTAAEGMDSYVQGYSKAQVTFDDSKISLADAYGAEIAAYRITCNGKSFSAPYRTDVLSTAGGQTVTATVIDSRGYEVSQELSLFTEQYTKPALSDIVIFRCGEDGEKDDEGSYVSVTATGHISSIAGLNHRVLHIVIGQVVSTEIPNGVTSVVGEGAVLHTSTYPVTLTVTDALGNRDVYTQLLPTADVMFHGRKGGKGAAFGKYGEVDDLLDVNWNLRVRKGLDATRIKIDGVPLWEYFMPVGYVYISVNPTSPAELYGGTWEKIEGRFLFAANSDYPVGTTGGAAAHSHGLAGTAMAKLGGQGNTIFWSYSYTGSWDAEWQMNTSGNGGASSAKGVDGVDLSGKTNSTTVMPPYLAVYMWKRVE